MEGETIKWPAGAAAQTTGMGSIFEERGTGSAAGAGGIRASGEQSASTAQGSQAESAGTMSKLAAESSGERTTGAVEDYESYARWRGGSDRGMRSVEGTGRLGRKPEQSGEQ